jgi:outer membrane protein TolC
MNMKKLVVFTVSCLFFQMTFSQGIDYNKIILPDQVRTDDMAEKLVQLAWKNHPSNEILKSQLLIDESAVKLSASQWLDIVNVQFNVNQFVLDPESDILGRAQFYPRYNIGARIPLGIFVSVPNQVKQDKQRVEISKQSINAQKLKIRNVVLKAYNDYLLAEKIYKLQFQQYNDSESNMKLTEQRFKNGEITFDAYTNNQAAFNRIAIQQLQAETELKNKKLDLEQLVGVKLEDVL